jgi:hypothetical protein
MFNLVIPELLAVIGEGVLCPDSVGQSQVRELLVSKSELGQRMER